jgi:TRAP-type C4-dicarboxylate transport system permease small subunit
VIRTAIHQLRRFNNVLRITSGLVLLLLLALTLANIIGRRFDRPVAGVVEMTELLMAMMVFLAIGFGEDQRAHITVDLLYERLGPASQRSLDLFSRAVAMVVVGLMIWQLWEYADSQAAANRETTILQWPLSPFVRVAALGALMLLLATASNFLIDLLGYDDVAEDDHVPEQAI